jgi:hypothetical protein
MSGIWYALATLAIAMVIRWYIRSEAASSDGARKSAKIRKFHRIVAKINLLRSCVGTMTGRRQLTQ